MKFLKIYFIFLSLIFLSGCVQSTALLGPGLTVISTGNVMQAGFQYGAIQLLREKQEKILLNTCKKLLIVKAKVKNLMKSL